MSSFAIATRLMAVIARTESATNPTIRVGTWVAAAAVEFGLPLELSVAEIQHGFTRDGKRFVGTRCHHQTIRHAFDWLQDNDVLHVVEGASQAGGHPKRVIDKP